jgi:hypothetical protein
MGASLVRGTVDADPSAGAGLAAPVGSRAVLDTGLAEWRKAAAADTEWDRLQSKDDIADPGNAGAIGVTRSGYCSLTTAGAETRTLADPSYEGQEIVLQLTVFVGNCVITVANTIDTAGNTTITMGNAKDQIQLIAADVGGNLRWSVGDNDGCALT